MTAQLPLPGPTKESCGCGCGRFGSLRTKVWRDGTRCVKFCECPRCQGGRVKARARTRENRIAKDVGGTRAFASGILTGFDVASSVVEIEETSNQTIVRGIRRWWNSKTVEAKVARLMSHRRRARALVLHWDKAPRLAVMPYTDFVELAQLAESQTDDTLLRKLEALVLEAKR